MLFVTQFLIKHYVMLILFMAVSFLPKYSNFKVFKLFFFQKNFYSLFSLYLCLFLLKRLFNPMKQRIIKIKLS